jgi:uncharacterized protein DUF2442
METTNPRVNYVRYVADYGLELGFTDGVRSEIDFRDRIVGRSGVFRPLADFNFFRKVRVEPESGTIIWPNGLDFFPDVLYSLAMGQPIDTLRSEAVS